MGRRSREGERDVEGAVAVAVAVLGLKGWEESAGRCGERVVMVLRVVSCCIWW